MVGCGLLLFFLADVATTSTVPAVVDRGAVTVHWLVVVQLTDAPRAFLNAKVVAFPSANPLPVTVTTVPPLSGPLWVLRAVIVGEPNTNLALVVAALVPPGVLTLTSTDPVVSAGDSAVIEVAETTV